MFAMMPVYEESHKFKCLAKNIADMSVRSAVSVNARSLLLSWCVEFVTNRLYLIVFAIM